MYIQKYKTEWQMRHLVFSSLEIISIYNAALFSINVFHTLSISGKLQKLVSHFYARIFQRILKIVQPLYFIQ